MVNTNYTDSIFQVIGEAIQSKPFKILDSDGVFLFIDMNLSLIWIWAGKNSRLFHRYIAANWAGKLKRKKKFFNFKYEMVKEGREPLNFFNILDEIENSNSNHDYAGQIKQFKASKALSSNFNQGGSSFQQSSTFSSNKTLVLSKIEKTRLKMVISEIKEMQNHIQYTFNHIEKKIAELEKKIGM